jgi:RNA polymerase sigma factor (sigma-70 family)
MPDTIEPFADLLARARQGDRAALAELARQYEPEVRIMARVLLGPALRPFLDSLDLVQSVHRSLMVGLRNEKFELASPDRLVVLAVAMVRRKIGRLWRHHQRQKRLAGGGPDSSLPDALNSLSTPDGDPARAVQVRDAIQHLCAHLDDGERQIMELRLQGHTTAEVARALGQDADVLRVRLSRLRQRLRSQGLLDEWL